MHMQFISNGIYIEGVLECEALLESGGKTPVSITSSTYGVVIIHSAKYKRDLPHLSNVTGFGDVCIVPLHSSTPSTLGVGSLEPEKTPPTPLKTDLKRGLGGGEEDAGRFEALFARIQEAIYRKEPVVMEVVADPVESVKESVTQSAKVSIRSK